MENRSLQGIFGECEVLLSSAGDLFTTCTGCWLVAGCGALVLNEPTR